MLFNKGVISTSCSVQSKQSELAKELKITRQALNVHLRKLRSYGLIRTGRGFLDITSKGLDVLGVSSIPAFVFVKVLPQKRADAYKKISSLPVWQMFRVAGEMDLVFVIGRDKLDDILQKISQIEGVEETHSYIAIESLK
jgi:DNA-binding Lrp family transcriptional regulator